MPVPKNELCRIYSIANLPVVSSFTYSPKKINKVHNMLLMNMQLASCFCRYTFLFGPFRISNWPKSLGRRLSWHTNVILAATSWPKSKHVQSFSSFCCSYIKQIELARCSCNWALILQLCHDACTSNRIGLISSNSRRPLPSQKCLS